jgi:hypothetical protein
LFLFSLSFILHESLFFPFFFFFWHFLSSLALFVLIYSIYFCISLAFLLFPLFPQKKFFDRVSVFFKKNFRLKNYFVISIVTTKIQNFCLSPFCYSSSPLRNHKFSGVFRGFFFLRLVPACKSKKNYLLLKSKVTKEKIKSLWYAHVIF